GADRLPRLLDLAPARPHARADPDGGVPAAEGVLRAERAPPRRSVVGAEVPGLPVRVLRAREEPDLFPLPRGEPGEEGGGAPAYRLAAVHPHEAAAGPAL